MYRVLYVDDEPPLLEIGKMFLESDGTFSVDTYPSAVDALTRLASARYDAIVSDYQMPVMDGITFLKTLRKGGNTTPFIIFTGRGREEVVIEALNSGADFYLQKGGDPTSQFTELVHKIRHAIQRNHAELALKKSEREYRHLIEYANEVIAVVQEGIIQLVNPKAVELSGFSEQELLNQPVSRVIHPDDCGMLLENVRKQLAGENLPNRYTFRLLRKDGSARWVELSVVAIEWDERPATLNFVTDITDRKNAEDALRESEERYRLFFKTALDSVFITTPEGRYIDFNDTLMKYIGATNREKTFAMNVIESYAHPEERTAFLEMVKRNGYVREHPIQFRRLDGTIFDALISLVPQKNPDGSIRAFVGTVRDVSGRKSVPDQEDASDPR